MITDAEGYLSDPIQLTDIASKGKGGRVIPLNKELRAALERWKLLADVRVRPSPFVVTTERS